ncbi:MAG: 8-amino-7-oxononanoate synthase [Spirochaetales bacterium]|nr:8-amino-7-oxononanoate synthase [Spirochaetales bacterium]
MNFDWQDFFLKDKNKKQAEFQFRELKVLEENKGREIVYEGKKLINFASNDYLGLCHNQEMIEAGNEAARKWGAGSGASRLVSGTIELTREVEEGFARLVNKEEALLFNSGYSANTGILAALSDRDTFIFTDRLNHASIYDGLGLCRGQMRRYPHNDMPALKNLLEQNSSASKKIIITDSLFSMDGDKARLEELADIKEHYGALLIVDEAHSMGVFGPWGSGLVRELGLEKRVDVIIGTLGKAFGVFGAFIASSLGLKEYLVNHSRPFIFTTALPPFVLGALKKATEIIACDKRGIKLLEQAKMVREMLNQIGINTGGSESQIIPMIIGDNARAIGLMEKLLSQGYFAPAIRPPTVPLGTSRVRLSLSAFHRPGDLEGLITAIKHFQG